MGRRRKKQKRKVKNNNQQTYQEFTFGYTGLTKEQAILKCQEVEVNTNLTIEEKIEKFHEIGYEIAESLFLSYTLEMPNDILIGGLYKCCLPEVLFKYTTFYESKDDNLPNIVMIEKLYPPYFMSYSN